MIYFYKYFKGPYKSALIAALVFYCAQGAAIEEKKSHFSIAALLYCGAAAKTTTAAGAAIEEHRNSFSIAALSIVAITYEFGFDRSPQLKRPQQKKGKKYFSTAPFLLRPPQQPAAIKKIFFTFFLLRPPQQPAEGAAEATLKQAPQQSFYGAIEALLYNPNF